MNGECSFISESIVKWNAASYEKIVDDLKLKRKIALQNIS